MASKDDLFLHEVRVLQRRTRCSNFVCTEFVRAYRKLAPNPVERSLKDFDIDAKDAAGSNYIILNGCPECNRHVYLPTEKAMTCPFVKRDGNICGHPRFDTNKRPFEVRILFLLTCFFLFRCIFMFKLFYLLCLFY